jgi:hypothetical protein
MKAAARITPAFQQALLRQPVSRAALAGPSQVRGLATEAAEPAPEADAVPVIPANLTFVDMAPPTKKQSAAALRELGCEYPRRPHCFPIPPPSLLARSRLLPIAISIS